MTYGGRLTNQPGTPVLTGDVTSQAVAYSPCGDSVVSIFDGTTMSPRNFLATTLDQVGPTLAMGGALAWAADTVYDVFAALIGGAVILGTGPGWNNLTGGSAPPPPPPSSGSYSQITSFAAFFTSGPGVGGNPWTRLSAAFDGVRSKTAGACAWNYPSNSGMANYIGVDLGAVASAPVTQIIMYGPSDDGYRGDEGSALPAEFLGSLDGVNFVTLWSGTVDAAAPFSNIDTINSALIATTPYRYYVWGFAGNGINAVKVAQLELYQTAATGGGSSAPPPPPPAPGSTRQILTNYDGVIVNAAPITLQTGPSTSIAVPAYQATFLGSILIDATPGTVTVNLSYGLNRKVGVSNAFNRRPICLQAGEPGTGAHYEYSVVTQTTTSPPYLFEPSHAQPGNMLTVLSTLADQSIPVRYSQSFFLNSSGAAAAYWAGIGRDGSLTPSSTWIQGNYDVTGIDAGSSQIAAIDAPPFAGIAQFQAIEGGRGNVSAAWGNTPAGGNMLLGACFDY